MSITPAVTQTLVKKGFKVNIEWSAGTLAKFRNDDYEQVGAKLVNNEEVFNSGKVDKQIVVHFVEYNLVCRYYFKSKATVGRGSTEIQRRFDADILFVSCTKQKLGRSIGREENKRFW